jgi:ribosomal protein L11 methyltransferase
VRRIEMRVPTTELDAALDRLLALLPYGVHCVDEGDTTRLVALGEPHELSPVDALESACGPLLVAPPRAAEVADLRAELDRLRPAFRIGGRLVVRTPHSPAPEPGVVDVVIEQTAGFGTGAHPTTRLVLEVLLDLEPGGPFGDLGCGAGAVAVAAAKLGWAPVWGVDFSATGLAEARANAERNGVAASFMAADLREGTPLPDARVAVVNVSEEGVHDIQALREWGMLETLVVSGIRRGRDAEDALAAYAAAGFVEREARQEGAWVAAVLDRPGS